MSAGRKNWKEYLGTAVRVVVSCVLGLIIVGFLNGGRQALFAAYGLVDNLIERIMPSFHEAVIILLILILLAIHEKKPTAD